MINVDLNAEASELAGRRILVTGACGFIGSHLTEAMVRAGFSVRAFVMYNSFNSWGWLDHADPQVKSSLDVVAGDIRDQGRVRSAMRGCDTVLHLAALISIPYSYTSPEAFIDTNVKGTLNVVQAARDLDVRRVVVTSTSEVYGTARTVPITENHALQGQSPYAASKIGADHLALSFHAAFGTPVTVLRPFNTYGPRQSARAIIPTVIGQICDGQRRLQLGSLHPTRDFSFVADTVRGFVRAAAAPGVLGEVVNIGSGFEISIGETVSLVAELMNADVSVELDDQRLRPASSEVERLYAGIDKAAQRLSWKPHYGGREGFRRGLSETIAWFANEQNRASQSFHRYNI